MQKIAILPVLLMTFMTTACFEDSTNTAISQAGQAVKNEDFQKAITILEKLDMEAAQTEQKKEWQKLYYESHQRLAGRLVKEGAYDQAAALYSKMSDFFPLAVEPKCLLAQSRLLAGELDKGGVALSRCIAAAENNNSAELQEFIQVLQDEYRKQQLLADGRIDALIELYIDNPDSEIGRKAAQRLVPVLLQALQNPAVAGAPQNGQPEPFAIYFNLLTLRFPESVEAKTAIEHYEEYRAAYNDYYAAELVEFKRFHDYQLRHSFCKQMELYYIKMRRVSLEVGMLVDIWIKSNNAKRMSGEERIRLAQEYGHEKVASQQADLLELRQAIKNTRPASSQQKWLYDRMNTAVNGLTTLQRVTDEYLATQNERARQQRNNIASWLDFFILQLNLDTQWVCPDSDALPPAVNQEPI